MKKIIFALAVLTSTASFSHFQMINTENLLVDSAAKKVNFDIMFTHPASNGHLFSK